MGILLERSFWFWGPFLESRFFSVAKVLRSWFINQLIKGIGSFPNHFYYVIKFWAFKSVQKNVLKILTAKLFHFWTQIFWVMLNIHVIWWGHSPVRTEDSTKTILDPVFTSKVLVKTYPKTEKTFYFERFRFGFKYKIQKPNS